MLTSCVAWFGDATDGAPDPPTTVSTVSVGGIVQVTWSGGSAGVHSKIYVNGLFLVETTSSADTYATGYPLALVHCVQVSHVSAAGLESSATPSTSGGMICP